MASRRHSSGIVMLFWVIILMAGLLVYLEYKKPGSQKNIYDKVKGYLKSPKVDKAPAGEKVIELYFFKYIEKKDKLALFKVERKIRQTDTPLSKAIDLLLAGPTAFEEKSKFSSVIGANTRLLDAKVKNKIAYLDFSSEIEKGIGKSMLETRLYQIVYTATQFPEVEGVKILIDGKEKSVFSSERIPIRMPLKRLKNRAIF